MTWDFAIGFGGKEAGFFVLLKTAGLRLRPFCLGGPVLVADRDLDLRLGLGLRFEPELGLRFGRGLGLGLRLELKLGLRFGLGLGLGLRFGLGLRLDGPFGAGTGLWVGFGRGNAGGRVVDDCETDGAGDICFTAPNLLSLRGKSLRLRGESYVLLPCDDATEDATTMVSFKYKARNLLCFYFCVSRLVHNSVG